MNASADLSIITLVMNASIVVQCVLALLLLARALFGPVTSRAGMTALGEHRWDTPPLRRREE